MSPETNYEPTIQDTAKVHPVWRYRSEFEVDDVRTEPAQGGVEIQLLEGAGPLLLPHRGDITQCYARGCGETSANDPWEQKSHSPARPTWWLPEHPVLYVRDSFELRETFPLLVRALSANNVS